MRILIASDHYPPFIGGAQRQTRLLARELKRRGHEVAVATVWQDDRREREDDGGIDVHRIRQLRTLPVVRGTARRRHQPPFPDPVSVLELRRLIRRWRPDVVHAAGWFSYSCAAALLGTEIPLLYSARDYGFSCPNATLVRDGALCSGPSLAKCLPCAGAYYGKPRGWLATLGVRGFERLLRRRVTTVHSVSRYVESIVERDFLPAGGAPFAVAPAVIPSFRFEDAADGDPAILDVLPREPFILFVGALRRVKGLQTLLAAYAGIEKRPPLVLLGTPEPDTPRELPEGAVIVPALPNWAVLRAWDRALFGVMPSLWPEPFGSVVHEAMSRGRAVIGTTPGGHADMILDGENGFLVASGDVEALRAAMERLIEDPQEREALGRRAAARARDFAGEVVVPRFEALYEELAA